MKPIMAGILKESRSNLVYHALRPDGTAACSNYLNVSREGPARLIPHGSRCRAKACQSLFRKADEPSTANKPVKPSA